MNQFLKRSTAWIGGGLAFFGVGFVALRLRDYHTEIGSIQFGCFEWSAAGGLALLYGLSNLMLAMAWLRILEQLGCVVSYRWSIRVYGISQIARYVPGNIFHLAGRQILGLSSGVPSWTLAKSITWELGLILVAGGLIGLLALPLLLPKISVMASSGIFILIFCLVLAFLGYTCGWSIVSAFCWYTWFLVLSGATFGILVNLLGESLGDGPVLASLIGAYVVAWLIGLITPGAPAGVGVRELVLLALLKGTVEESDLLLAVMLGRAVTVFGDIIFFAVASVMDIRR